MIGFREYHLDINDQYYVQCYFITAFYILLLHSKTFQIIFHSHTLCIFPFFFIVELCPQQTLLTKLSTRYNLLFQWSNRTSIYYSVFAKLQSQQISYINIFNKTIIIIKLQRNYYYLLWILLIPNYSKYFICILNSCEFSIFNFPSNIWDSIRTKIKQSIAFLCMGIFDCEADKIIAITWSMQNPK